MKRIKKEHTKRASPVSLSMVGFFDILGFANAVEKVESEEELLKVAEKVESIRKHFEYQSHEKDIKTLHSILGKEVLAFSDSVVTAVSIQNKFARQEGIFDTLGSQLADIAYSQINCIWDGYFLRGGVDCGVWYHHKGLMVSPALVAAYKLERDKARYPVIAISDRLYELLSNDTGRNMYSKDFDPLPNEVSSYVGADGEPVHFINYLRVCADSVDWQFDRSTRDAYMAAPPDSEERGEIMAGGHLKSLISLFRLHKEKIEAAHAAAEEKVKEKYVFLEKYHNEELRRYKSPDLQKQLVTLSK